MIHMYNDAYKSRKDEVERLEFIIIESGNVTIEPKVQYNPVFRDNEMVEE